jgi:hypothetical protein
MADYSGCGYYRVQLPLSALHAGARIDATWGTVLPGRRTQILLGQRVCTQGATGRWQQLACDGDVRLVLDLDDDLWHIDPASTVAYRAFDQVTLGRLDANLAVADHVIVSTPHLVGLVRDRTDAPVTVVGNAVPDWLPTYPVSAGRRLVVGWAGSQTHAEDWRTVPDLARAVEPAGATLRLHGPDPGVRIPDWGRVDRGWVRDVEAHLKGMSDWTVGLAPLAPTRFNLSKSPLRLLELGALRVPVVASAYGPYADHVEHGVTGLLVDPARPSDWVEHVRALLADPGLRDRLAAAAHAETIKHTISRMAHHWYAAITGQDSH